MTPASAAAGRPPILLAECEADALTALALAAAARAPLASRMLLEEIDRAQCVSRAELPADVVTMNARVTFRDQADGETYEAALVYPGEADADAGRLSILTPVGAGLIGLRCGQFIDWPNLAGRHRRLEVLAVVQPAPADA